MITINPKSISDHGAQSPLDEPNRSVSPPARPRPARTEGNPYLASLPRRALSTGDTQVNPARDSPTQTIARRASLPVWANPRLELSALAPIVSAPKLVTTVADRKIAAQEKVRSHLLAMAKKHYPGIDQYADLHASAARAAETFVHRGLDTPAKIEAWTRGVHVHDVTMTLLGFGFFDNIGYAISMEGFFNNIIPTPLVCDTLATAGAFISVSVGGIDTLLSVVGGSVISEKLYNDRDCNDALPHSLAVQALSLPRTVLDDAVRAAALNFTKNGGLRVPAALFLPAEESNVLSRQWRNQTDTGLDAVGGFFSSAVNKTLKLNSGIPYELRLAYRSDLAEVIDKTEKTWATAIKETPAMIGRGVQGLASPVPLAVTAMITGFVTALFVTNGAVGKSFAAHGYLSSADEMTRNEAAARSMVSTVMMSTMTGAINLAAPAIHIGTVKLMDWFSTRFSAKRGQGRSDLENQAGAPDVLRD